MHWGHKVLTANHKSFFTLLTHHSHKLKVQKTTNNPRKPEKKLRKLQADAPNKRGGIDYRWREVSTSVSCPVIAFWAMLLLGHRLMEGAFSGAWGPTWSLRWRRDGGQGRSGWKSQFCCPHWTLELGGSPSLHAFCSSRCSLCSFTLCSCLNRSCSSAMEAWRAKGSPFCLPMSSASSTNVE